MKFFNPFLIITIFFLNSCASNFYQVPVAQGNIVSNEYIKKNCNILKVISNIKKLASQGITAVVDALGLDIIGTVNFKTPSW